MRPVLIGIAPARPGESGQPLSCIAKNSTGRRLRDILGITSNEYLYNFDRVNVCPHPTPSTIKAKEYADYAENLMGSMLRERRVVFLGPNVAECFGIKRKVYSFCEIKSGSTSPTRGLVGWRVGSALPCEWSVIPHPSGRNLWYNDEENVLAVKSHLVEALQWQNMRQR